MNAGPAPAARVEPASSTARGAAPAGAKGPEQGAAPETGPVGMPLYAMGAAGAVGAVGAGAAANASTIAPASAPPALGGLPVYAAASAPKAAGVAPTGQVVPLPTAGPAAAHGAAVDDAGTPESVIEGEPQPTAHDGTTPEPRRRDKHGEARKQRVPQKSGPRKTGPEKAGPDKAAHEKAPPTPKTAGAASAGAKPALPVAGAQGAAGAAIGDATAKPAAPAAAGAGAGAASASLGGGGGGGGGAAAGGAIADSAGGGGGGGDESAAVAGGEAGQAAAGEEAHDRMEQAEQPAQGEAAGDGGSAGGGVDTGGGGGGSGGGGGGSDGGAVDAGGDASEGAAAAEGAEIDRESTLDAASQAGAAGGAVPDPGEAERAQASEEAQDTQEQHRDAADAQSDEHANEQSERHADTGDAGVAGASAGEAGGGAEIGGGERDAGLASLGESVGGGGGGDAGGGGGGGGGGTPIPEPEPAPDTASGDPAAGLASASTLQPMQAATALGGVGSAIDNTVQEEGAALQSQMPEVEVGSEDAGGTAVVDAPGGDAPAAVPRAEAGAAQPTPEAEPQPEPGPAPTASIPTPFVSDGENGTVNREQASAVQGSVSAMPTTDPELDTSAGAPPAIAKTGDADPAQMQAQQGHLDATIAEQRAKGAADAALPAGERDVRDRTPRERLQAPKVAAGGAAGAAGVAVPDDESLGIVAESQKGGEVRAAMAQAQGDMAGKRAEHDKSVGEEKDKNDAELARLKADNRADQQAEKAKVQGEVGQARADWSAEQNSEIAKTNTKAKGEIAKGNQGIAKEETQGNTEATKALSQGETEAIAEKQKAEREAAAKKRQAEKEQAEDSGGIFGWIASKVSSFFSALKNAITAVFDLAKRAVKWAIDKAKKAAVWAIEKARSAIVGLIRAVGAALIALGDVLLAAFPGLKKKWRSYIEGKVKAAENAVNRLADALKKGVTKLLDALGKAFDFLLDAYKKAMLFVLDAAKGVVMGAINAAKAIAQLLGTFVVLIKDIARSPGDWLSKLGAAAVDGIKNHLWGAFKTAVKAWFNGKLEETLGIGLTIWNVLKKGGITIKEVGHMAFEALKEAIPPALIQLLVEKLVAMIVPAAGAVMAIIEGLQAAWGTVQKIIAAIGKFVAFLKAVKSGGAGPSFAEMLASAAIVVIDFVANWLLKRLRKPAGKVAGKVKAIAQKILAKIKGALKKVGGALKKAGGWVKGKFKAGKKKVGDWWAKKKAKRQAKKQAKHDAKHAAKDGKPDPAKKKKDKDAANQAKLDKAVAAIRPELARMLSGGSSKLVFKAKLLFLRLRHGLSGLGIEGNQVVARVNPKTDAATMGNVSPHAAAIAQAMLPVLLEVLGDYDREVLGKGEAKDQVGATKEQILHPAPGNKRVVTSLDQVPDDVRQAALRAASKEAREGNKLDPGIFGVVAGEPSQRVQLGQDVTAKAGHPSALSRIEVQALGGPYDRISQFATKRQSDFGLSSDQVIGAASASSPAATASRISALGLDQRPGPSASKAAFERRLRRMSMLNSLENARLPEASIAMQLAGDVAGTPGHAKTPEGTAKVGDLYGPGGDKAPQTPVGAASQPSHPQHEEGQRLKHERIGNIVSWLIGQIRADLVINDGFSVGPLIDAMSRFIKNQRGSNEKKLKLLLMEFLKSRHGR